MTWTTAARFPLLLVSASARARNDAAPTVRYRPREERAAQRVAERRRVVAREPGVARLGGFGDGDLDDPRHPPSVTRADLYQNRRTPYCASSSRR